MTAQRLTYLGLESYGWTFLVVLCFAVAVGLVVWLYRYERQLVSGPIGWTLMSLRVLLLVVLLFMALQPTLSWTTKLKQDNSILVALDVSQSMDLLDEQATELERKQWAAGLGMIRAELLKEDAGNQAAPPAEPTDDRETSEEDSDSSDEETAEDDASELMASWETLSRFDLARQLLSAPKIGLLDRLSEIANVELLLFSKDLKRASGEDLTGSRDRLSEGLTSASTSFTSLIEEVATRENVAAAVIISDGVDTSPQKPQAQLNRLAGQSRPVYSILAGSTSQPVDLAIESIDHPESVYQNDQPLIQVRATTHGYEGKTVAVSLTDVSNGNRLTKNIDVDDRYEDVEFSLPLNTAGRQRFIVDISPVEGAGGNRSEEPAELQLDNNQQEFAVNVIDDSTHVLLVAGEASWEFRFIDAAYERDDRVELDSVLFEQPYLGLLPTSFFDTALPNSRTSTGPFEGVDLVIWGDADPKAVDAQTWERLERFVGEQGGTLVVYTGKRHFSGIMQNPILSKLMPITHTRRIEAIDNENLSDPIQRGFHLQLTPQGALHPAMKLETDHDANIAAWRNLPGHFLGYVGDPKPAAVVLATPVGATIASTSTRPAGTVVAQNYGLGRVMWLGIDSTWRWRLRRGDKDHYRFWGQLSRWAAEMRSSAGSDDVRLALESTEIEEGDETMIRARWSQAMHQNLPEEVRTEIEVYPRDVDQLVPIMRFPLDRVETEPMLQEAKVPPLPVGEYRLRLAARDVPLGPAPIEATLFVTPRQNGETNRLSADRTLLEQFAAATNGAVFLPHQLDELLDRLNPEWRTLEQKQDFPLWNHWLLFVMIVAIVTAEWLVRKWHGLP